MEKYKGSSLLHMFLGVIYVALVDTFYDSLVTHFSRVYKPLSVSPENRSNSENAICMVFDVFFHAGAIALISGSVRALPYIFIGTLLLIIMLGLWNRKKPLSVTELDTYSQKRFFIGESGRRVVITTMVCIIFIRYLHLHFYGGLQNIS